MMSAATAQEAKPTEWGRWSVQHGLLGVQWMHNRPRYSSK